MRVVRVKYDEKIFYGHLTETEVICLNKDLGIMEPIPLEQVVVLPPVVPTKVIGVALNYAAHAGEMDKPLPQEPMTFLKPPSSVIGSGQAIVLPGDVGRVDYEGELAVVAGKTCRGVSLADAPDHIFGYACANDVTARDLQARDVQYGRAKGFDTFCPVGPWIETEVVEPEKLALRTLVNGEVKQESNTSDMLFSPLELFVFVSRIMTLYPGDVILTGTPPGIGPLAVGDEVRVEIEQVGLLINPVVAEAARQEPSPSGPVQ